MSAPEFDQPDSAFREAIRRSWHDAPAPPRRLLAAVQAGLDAEDRRRQVSRRVPRAWWTVPAAIAAGLLLAVLVWQYARVPEKTGPVVVYAQPVADFQEQHLECRSHVGMHHDPSLPRTGQGISDALSKRLGFFVLAPDYPADTCTLDSANVCSVGDHEGAHVLYRLPSGEIMSLFSMPACTLEGGESVTRGPCRFVSEQVGKTCVVGWRSPGAAHVMCADIKMDALLDLAARTCSDHSQGVTRTIHSNCQPPTGTR